MSEDNAPERRDADDARKRGARGRLKRAVQKTAPALAEALGGPLAGAAVEALSRAVFGRADAGEEAIEEALARANPEHALALLKAEREFALALRQADVEQERIAAGDRASARERHRAMGDMTPAALGAAIIVGFFAVLAAMLMRAVPPGAESEFQILLGALATMTAAVVNYYFGSSAGSKEKTRLLSFPRGSPEDA